MEYIGIGILIALVIVAVVLQNTISSQRGFSSHVPYGVSAALLAVGFVLVIVMTYISRFVVG